MNKRDTLEPPGAVLDPEKGRRHFTIARYEPGDELAPFVRHFWIARWDLRGQPPYRQEVLTPPAVNLVFEGGKATVSGAQTRRFVRLLEGEGAAFGALFLPAGFQAFWRRSMHELTDRVLPVADVLTGDPARLLEGGDDAAVLSAYLEFLRTQGAVADDEAGTVNRWVAQLEASPEIGRVEELAEHLGVGLRTLQRALRYYVGVTPKWLIRRIRVLRASHLLSAEPPKPQASVGIGLGYADQSHFNREFRTAIGRPPGRYAADQQEPGQGD